ncbi:hypothetical protein DB31_6756 [Hyalangium minutum]|uniref:Uncharacterized protein n=1 Tax=Hyalangium minutum TaxID=394096 RepID=A0A085WME1_9BACT|nr:hypothetical protein DB31_6756 [Hyalangium minutum]
MHEAPAEDCPIAEERAGSDPRPQARVLSMTPGRLSAMDFPEPDTSGRCG